MTRITTHVLDTAAGRPAADIAVTLWVDDPEEGWREVARAVTDGDGRIGSFPEVEAGRTRLTFTTGSRFFPEIDVSFVVEAGREHLHVPLLLSPYSYSVYRGS